MSLGPIIKTLRTTRGFTQPELADALNQRFNTKINKAMLSKWENDRESPSLTYVKQMAIFFGVSLDYLLENDYTANIDSKDERISSILESLDEEGRIKFIEYGELLLQAQANKKE